MTEVTVRIHQGIGGGERDRTDDLLLAKQALSQLSYTPVMVGLRRVELLTSPLSGVRSNQLSYRPGNVSSLRSTECIRIQARRRRPTRRAGGLATTLFYQAKLKQFRDLEGMRGQRHGLFLLLERIEINPSSSLKGGDPAAGSPTATLLRLHPSR